MKVLDDEQIQRLGECSSKLRELLSSYGFSLTFDAGVLTDSIKGSLFSCSFCNPNKDFLHTFIVRGRGK